MRTRISSLLSLFVSVLLASSLLFAGCSKDDEPADMGLAVSGSYTGDLLSGLEIDPEAPVSSLVPLVLFEKLTEKSVRMLYPRFSPEEGIALNLEIDLTLSSKSGGKYAFNGQKSFTVNNVVYLVTVGGEGGDDWVDLSIDVLSGSHQLRFGFQGDRISEELLDFSALVAGNYSGSWYAQLNQTPVVPDPSGTILIERTDVSHIRIQTESVLFAEDFPVSLNLETAIFKRLGGHVVDRDSAQILIPAELSPSETPFMATAIYSCSFNGGLLFFDLSIADIGLLVSFSGNKP